MMHTASSEYMPKSTSIWRPRRVARYRLDPVEGRCEYDLAGRSQGPMTGTLTVSPISESRLASAGRDIDRTLESSSVPR